MDNILLKYNLLDAASKKEARAFIDQLVAKMRNSQKAQSSYKKRILEVSTWS